MTTYEQQVINGVPFLISGTNVYFYDTLCLPWSSDPKEPIRIGTLAGTELRLEEGWITRVQPRVDAWRTTINPVGRNEIVRAPKQSKPKRSPKSAAKAAGTAVEATATVATAVATEAAAEPTPPSVVKRRRTVRTNAS
jgi:hypothetical protein